MTELAESLQKCKIEGNILFLPSISEGALVNYPEVRKALLNAGAKYKRNTFVFSSDAQPFIDRLCGGESVNIKKEFQFFPTPEDISDWMVELAELNEEDMILEPSAGQGAIVKSIHKHIDNLVFGFELMPENQNILREIEGFELIGSDFLKEKVGYFTKIIANPPFSKNQDIDHIRKMYDCLATGGVVVTVASKHWQLSSNRKETEFRDWLENLEATIYPIESGRFKESGTMVSSCIIVINKYV